jgi:hypothetical protein
MAKVNFTNMSIHEPKFKKTSIGGNKSSIKTSSMNKHKRRSYKAYRGQGK